MNAICLWKTLYYNLSLSEGNLKESATPSVNDSSSSILQNGNSNSLLGRKVIAWFCAGAFGYAAIYVVGKNIADK
jgi:hypothetical protein